MLGQMMQMPLTISSLIEHADRYHGDTEIVSRTVEGPSADNGSTTTNGIHRYTYAEAHTRSRQLANALNKLGAKPGDRVATLAWNGYRHFELYYAISGMGAVIHTVNPRLFPEQINWIVNNAEDSILFFDLTFAPLVEAIADQCPTVKHWVAMTDRAHMPDLKIDNLLCYEELISAESDDYAWPAFDENTAAALCYTSGTTGNPKGVLYSHRSTLLHSFSSALPDTMNLSGRDVILPVVPMFHVNAWGIPYTAAMVGAKLVLPGAGMDGPSLCELFEAEKVTYSAGVPTVWLAVLQHLQSSGTRLSTVQRMIVGGSACPPALMKTYQQDYGVTLQHLWGMTELSPLGTANTFKEKHLQLDEKSRFEVEVKQGRPPFGVDLKIVDDQGQELPRDGKTAGDLLARGHWVLNEYYRRDESPLEDGWFPTGDVANLDKDGFMQITDRSKDVIKSGGEWISSIELENIAMEHPAVAEAAAIGMPHPKWDERPLIVVVTKEGQTVSPEEILALYPNKVAKWSIPNDVTFTDEIPHTATGKISKLQLRQKFDDYQWPESER